MIILNTVPSSLITFMIGVVAMATAISFNLFYAIPICLPLIYFIQKDYE